MKNPISRRQLLYWTAAGTGSLLLSPAAWAALKTPGLTEGPFYPRAGDLLLDQDNDLTTISGKSGVAAGVLLDLSGRVVDEKDRPVANALVEIWQCDGGGRYRHGGDRDGPALDPYFQGYGKMLTDAEGRYRFRTIRPVPYPGRTPHIHYKVKSRDFDELTSQIFVAGDPRNERDGVLRAIRNEADRKRVMMELKPAAAGNAVPFTADFEIVLG